MIIADMTTQLNSSLVIDQLSNLFTMYKSKLLETIINSALMLFFSFSLLNT